MPLSFLYDFSTQVTEPPTSSQLRFDSADPATVTRLWIRSLTTDGIDAHRLLLAQPIGALVYVQDKNDHTLAVAFTLASAPVDKTSYVEWPVAFASTTGAPLLNNQAVLLLALEPVSISPEPPTPGPGLVSLADAKASIRLAADDTSQDDFLTLTLAAAEAIILDFLNTTEAMRAITATWDATSVPRPVSTAIKLEFGELWRFRGDDPEPPMRWADTDLSPVIIGLLRRLSPVVLA